MVWLLAISDAFESQTPTMHQTEYPIFEAQTNVIKNIYKKYKKKPIKVVVAQLGLGQNEWVMRGAIRNCKILV